MNENEKFCPLCFHQELAAVKMVYLQDAKQ